MPQPPASGSLEQQGAFSARGSGIVLRVSMGRSPHSQAQLDCLRLAHEGFQAAEGEVGRWPSCRQGWARLGAWPGGGNPESVQAVCVLYSSSLWVGRSRSLRTLPPHQPPGKGGGVREEGVVRLTLPLPPLSVAREQEDQEPGEPQASSVQRLFSSCVSFAWCGSSPST